jgi:hypothetical protein
MSNPVAAPNASGHSAANTNPNRDLAADALSKIVAVAAALDGKAIAEKVAAGRKAAAAADLANPTAPVDAYLAAHGKRLYTAERRAALGAAFADKLPK